MPKMKTHKGTAKRYRKTGSGKWIRPKAWPGNALVSSTHTDALERLMPYAGKGK